MKTYNFKVIEKKWQKQWEESEIYKAKDFSKKEKFYCLIEFPYPSGVGLHTGHVRSYVAIDIIARKQRMQGKNVLYPIGWDAFGLPTENFAIKTKQHPTKVTKQNIKNYTKQIKSFGPSFDWSREINTTDPQYYKWTQWIFLKFYNSFYDTKTQKAKDIKELAIPPHLTNKQRINFINNHRLAYEQTMPINWCPSCKIGLANEEVVAGNCERCGTVAEKREMKQWMLRITKYADRLINDLNTVDYLDKIKTQQINWIGKSEGAEIKFNLQTNNTAIQDSITVFTTRPDTLFGCTYMVIAPEHPLIKKYQSQIENYSDILQYQKQAQNKSDIDRTELNKEKTGIIIEGIKAINPATNQFIPIWVADYVLMHYGTGAIMAVPAHDERDFAFAQQHLLPIIPVVQPEKPQTEVLTECYTGEGMMINSDFLNTLHSTQAKTEIIQWLKKQKLGKSAITYKLRDWVFSRQHYWGEPIPIIKCSQCGNVALTEKDLPLTLPKVQNYEPTDDGKSPLSKITKWTEVSCPTCKQPALRETDTMPNWAGSSWYFLRYIDPCNHRQLASQTKLNYWLPIDLYNGGMEHTTLHLLYSRFWYKFLFDLGYAPTAEPYTSRRSHGMVIGSDGQKMSKSRGNVVNPDSIIQEYGADTLRLYEMFMGPYTESIPWNTNSMIGSHRFLERVWKMQYKVKKITCKNDTLEILTHQSIKKVSEDIAEMKFNTAVAQLMIFTNALEKLTEIPQKNWETFLLLLCPFTPHITEELWHSLGHTKSIHLTSWPQYDPQKIQNQQIEFVIQINGKVRDRITIHNNLTETEAKQIALNSTKTQPYLQKATIKKIIFIPNKLINLVVI